MENKNKEIKTEKYPEEFYFDNCPICRGMKKAYESGRSLSLTETKKLFEKTSKAKINKIKN